jgi:predicted lysophospholipase L1 biosynthesis ABC-type transport system permease subunit
MRIPLLRGRDFAPQDDRRAPRVVIINQRMAERYWPGENPIGKTFTFGNSVEVVGVVGDTKYLNLREPDPLIVYTAILQGEIAEASLYVRALGDARSVMPVIGQEIRATGGRLTLSNLTTMQAQTDDLLSRERLLATIAALIGVLTILLAGAGLYSNVVYSVQCRAKEIGVRMALGATTPSIVRLFLKENVGAALVGTLMGIALVIVVVKVLATALYGVQPTAAPVIAGVAAILSLIVLAATITPVLRATRRQPLVVLRQH